MLKTRAEEATRAVLSALELTATPARAKAVSKLIEQAMVDAYRDSAERCAKVALECAEADRDKAHKIADQIRLANTALMANLSSLR